MRLTFLFKLLVISIISIHNTPIHGFNISDIEAIVNSAVSNTSSSEIKSEDDAAVSTGIALNKSFTDNDLIRAALRTPISERELNRLKRKEQERNTIEEMRREQLKEAHVNRVKEIRAFMINNHKATEFLYNEVKRIQREREVLDPIRKLIIEAETVGGVMEGALNNCTVQSLEQYKSDPWLKKPNKITWHHIADPFNDY